jgi:formate--tetrahydrofolate ligase
MSTVPSDIEIARAARLRPIDEVALKLGVPSEGLHPYGRHIAKLDMDVVAGPGRGSDGKLVLVTAISPTPAGEGKTTTTVGLGDGLNRIGRRAAICLREPSLGPCFGMKGGAAGGGYAQVVPMENINLHFTGDFHAIGSAHNLLAALVDNHIYWGNALGLDPRRISWRRAVDMNDRALRSIISSLGGVANGFPREDGFDITVASEVMAVFCLSSSLEELERRLGDMIVGWSRDKQPVRCRDLKAAGAMTVLLRDALMPNLVQTLEGNPALVHGGPFANIAHGCNSVIATRTALKLADYVVTEAGFGADLGAEKFLDIKCRKTGLRPSAAVIVATMRALKYHGGVDVKEVSKENLAALEKGLVNLERHVENVSKVYGIPCVVSINKFTFDTEAELRLVSDRMQKLGVKVVTATHWGDGGKGAADLAKIVVGLCEQPSKPSFVYEDADPLWEKINKIAKKVYRASEVTADAKVRAQIKKLQDDGYGHFPVCVAKTQSSFSTDAALRGAPSNHVVNVREVRLAAGAEFVVMICGDIMTMPGLPKVPSASKIDLVDGKVVGLF